MITVRYKLQPRSVYDTVGITTIDMTMENLGEKTIKYCTLTFVPLNKVNDVVSSDITNDIEASVLITGPIKKHRTHSGKFQNAWMNNSIVKAKLVRANIEYMDGTTEVIDGEEINKLSARTSPKSLDITAIATCFIPIIPSLICAIIALAKDREKIHTKLHIVSMTLALLSPGIFFGWFKLLVAIIESL